MKIPLTGGHSPASDRISVNGPAGELSVVRNLTGDNSVPLVFVHGMNGAAEQWSRIMTLMSTRSSIAIDLRGHGASEAGGGYDVFSYASDVKAVLSDLGMDRVHLVGTSFGASVCTTVAASSPQYVLSLSILSGALSVSGTADIDAVTGLLRDRGPHAFFADTAASSFGPLANEADIRKSVELAAKGRSIDTIEAVLRAALISDVTALAARVKAPSIVVTGEYDSTCPPIMGQSFAAALGAPLNILPGIGHMAHLESPADVTQFLWDHILAVEKNYIAPPTVL